MFRLPMVLVLLLWCSQNALALDIEKRHAQDASPKYEVELSWPYVGVEAIDRDVETWVKQTAEDFRAMADAENDPAQTAWTFEIDYEVMRNDAQVLALAFNISAYTGGAHGSLDLVTRNYRLPEGVRLDLRELLDGERALAKLSEWAIADLEKQLGGDDGVADSDWIRTGAAAEWNAFAAFLLLPDSLRIEFQPYQVGPWAIGPQTVSIPLSALAGFLREGSSVPTASFDCTQAATPVEKAICADVALARLDRQMADAYRQRLDANPDEAAERSAQRAWLKLRNSACKDQEGPLFSACLTGIYRSRLADLTTRR